MPPRSEAFVVALSDARLVCGLLIARARLAIHVRNAAGPSASQFILAGTSGSFTRASASSFSMSPASSRSPRSCRIRFSSGIPKELEEAMYIDGGNAWTVYWRLILPLSRPALATAGIFVFLASWDQFIRALTIIKGRSRSAWRVRLVSIEMDTQWWKSAVVYQIYPHSFADADGMGDMPGIRERARLLGASWRRRALVVADVSVAAGRHGLRHQRLHRYRPDVRHLGGLRRPALRRA